MRFVTTRPPNPLMASTSKILCTASLGVFFLVLPVLMHVLDPVLIIARYKTRVAPGSAVHELLKRELEAVHISAYLFNITNADRFLDGTDPKLKVEEVGPFTYRELRVNEDLELDMAARTVRYSPRVTPVFSREESVADPRDVNVTLPNIAMLSMISMMSSYPFLSRAAFGLMARQLGSRPVVRMAAHDYLWGYDEPLITLGNTFMPGWISFDTMGLMDRLYDKKVKYRLEVGAEDHDKFMIKKLNGVGGLAVWGYDRPDKRKRCNTFSDAYEGIAYPTDLSPATPVRIFRNVLCGMLELEYQETRALEYGPRALVFRISNSTWRGEDRCTCADGLCIDGVSDISPCFYNLPLATSNAHFLYGAPELSARVEGLRPDERKHGSEFLIEPKIGAVLTTSFSIQVNIVLGDVRYNEFTKRFADMVLPIGYFKIVQPELPAENKADLRLLYVTGPRVVLALQALLGVLAALLLLRAARLLHLNWECRGARAISFQAPVDHKPAAAAAAMPLINVGS